MHPPERLTALYAQTGNFPADNRWNPSQAKSPTDRTMLKWLAQRNVNYPANYYPTDVDVNANFVVIQGLFGGKMTVDQAVGTYASVIKKGESGTVNEVKVARAAAVVIGSEPLANTENPLVRSPRGSLKCRGSATRCDGRKNCRQMSPLRSRVKS